MRVIVGLSVIGITHDSGHGQKVAAGIYGKPFRLAAEVPGIGVGVGGLIIISAKGIKYRLFARAGRYFHVIHDTTRGDRTVAKRPSAGIEKGNCIFLCLPVGSIHLPVSLSLLQEIRAYIEETPIPANGHSVVDGKGKRIAVKGIAGIILIA